MSEKLSIDEACVMCDKAGAFACPICKGPMYCGKRHQNIHWTQHEAECNVVHTGTTDVAVLMPYDLIDDEGMPISTRTMLCCTDPEGAQSVDIIESEIGDESAEAIGARRSRFKERPKGVPKLLRPGLTRGIGPNEGVGSGRRPTPEELDNGNGVVTLQIEYWESYSDKQRGLSGKSWEITAPLNNSNVIFQGNPDQRVLPLTRLRAIREREGLVIWFDQGALDKLSRFALPTTGGYMQLNVKTSWDNRERSTDAVYGNLSYLRRRMSRFFKRFSSRSRLFGSGLTAKQQLRAKGLRPESDYILYMHDKRVGSGIRAQFTVRADDSAGMRIVDIELYLPDAVGMTTADSSYDTDAQFPVQVPVKVDIADQEQVDGLVCALKEQLATLETTAQELSRFDDLDLEGQQCATQCQQDATRVAKWLDTIEPHSIKLQMEGPSFVGAGINADFSDLHLAINQSHAFLVGAMPKFLKRAANKARQRQYQGKIKKEGVQWALNKLDDPDWNKNKSRLVMLRKALQTVKNKPPRKFRGDDFKALDEALALVKQYEGTLDM
jgi:hypothetical protein